MNSHKGHLTKLEYKTKHGFSGGDFPHLQPHLPSFFFCPLPRLKKKGGKRTKHPAFKQHRMGNDKVSDTVEGKGPGEFIHMTQEQIPVGKASQINHK